MLQILGEVLGIITGTLPKVSRQALRQGQTDCAAHSSRLTVWRRPADTPRLG